MNCRHCGKPNEAGYNFCLHCGESLKSESLLDAMSGEDILGGESIGALLGDDASLDDILTQEEGPEAVADGERHDSAPLLSAEELDMQPANPSGSVQSVAEAPEVIRVCAECGALIEQRHRFCGACGAPYVAVALPAKTQIVRPVPAAGMGVYVEKSNFIAETSKPQAQPARFALCHIMDDGGEGEEIPLFEGENILGRASSAGMRSDRFVSPAHCLIKCRGEFATIEDNSSLNGVFERLCGQAVELNDGDMFRVGEELIAFMAGDSKQAILTAKTGDDSQIVGSDELPGWGYIRVVLGAYAEGSVYRLYSECVTLGRTRANILFERDSFVSGVHAMISYDDGRVLLADLDSSNGTFVKIKKPISVHHNVVDFLIGNELLRLKPI